MKHGMRDRREGHIEIKILSEDEDTTIVDYRDNDLGDYNEAMIVFFVRPRGVDGGGVTRAPGTNDDDFALLHNVLNQSPSFRCRMQPEDARVIGARETAFYL